VVRRHNFGYIGSFKDIQINAYFMNEATYYNKNIIDLEDLYDFAIEEKKFN
jgi:hypothetical protein